jgi:Ca2+-binding RTX toxin-like protein
MLMAQANVASFMDALGGDDIVFGSDSLDIIFGGDGADKLFAGEGNDQTFGGNGDDYIFAEDGQDVVTGGAGSDWIFGGAGDDRLLATVGDADDAYYGDEGIDTLDMSAISANATVDLGSTSFGNGSAVSDQTGNDVLSSIENVITGSGADKIYANDAVNMINAGAGNDTILFGSAASADGDMIFGFETGDLICLQQMDANLGVSGLQGFTLVAGQSFSDAGQLMIRHEMRDGGEVSIIEGNIGGDFQADFRIEISGVLVQESNLLL